MAERAERVDGNREMAERAERANGGDDAFAQRSRERAGSPSPMAMDGRSAGSWQDIKGRFVDDPAAAIAAAEELVRLALEQRVRALKEEAAAIVAPGGDEESSSTEGMRTRLIRYQEYCERLAQTALH
jgi:hypothetical protein